MEINFSKKAFSGLKWTSLSAITKGLVVFFRVSILTRFLEMEAFGTIAIATLFLGVTNLFLDLGLSTGIIHKQQISKNEYSSLFWLNCISGLFLTLILMATAPLISDFYDDHSLLPIIVLLSFNVLFASLGRQHRTQRHKQLNFKFLAVVDNLSAIISLLIAVIFAYLGFGVYSLVYSSMVGVFLPNIIFLLEGLRKDKNIRWYFKFSETKSFLKIGMFQTGSGLFDYIGKEIDVIIISATFGRDTLGGYSLCKKMVVMLYGILSPVITTVLTPLLAQLQHDLKDLQQKFSQIISIISTITLPLFFLLALNSKMLLLFIYGKEYEVFFLIVIALSVNYGILSTASAVSSSQIALGRTDIGFYWTIFRIVTSILMVYLGSLISIEAVAFFILTGTIINIYPFYRIQVRTILKLTFKEYITPQIFPLILSLFLSLIVYGFTINSPVGRVTFSALFVPAYLIGLIYLSPDNYVVKKLKNLKGI